MKKKIQFLSQSINQIRKGIKGIDESYNHDWDILAELCQNAVDAIRKAKPEKGTIKLFIDSQNKAIKIEDDGCGISAKRLPFLLAPFSTDKEGDEETIGEKGVGLTFVIFSSNNFYIKSGDGKTASEGTILDAYNWKNSSTEDQLELSFNELKDNFKGTIIELKEVHNSSIFNLSFTQLKYLLRTKTALGNTNKIWDSDLDITILFKHTNLDGKTNEEEIPFLYHLPIEGYSQGSMISLDEFFQYIKEADRTDKQKRDKLFGKIIYKKGVFDHNGRSIKYWTCFVPKRETWNEISRKNNLGTIENFDDQEWIERHSFVLFKSGIYTSVKGMPTGISINTPVTGYQGYWAQLFMLFEDRYIKFDIGRKSLAGRQSEIYKKKAKDIFNEFAKIFKYVGRKDIEERPEWEKDEIFAEIDKELDIKSDKTKFLKVPSKQEASVAGMFYECIGNGLIQDIRPLLSGYKSKYDLYAKWGDRKIVLEFKTKLSNILADFNDEKKMFDELNCIVCWNVDEEDERAFKRKNIDLEPITHNELSNKVEFPNATHKLILAFVDPIYIIDMKKIIEMD